MNKNRLVVNEIKSMGKSAFVPVFFFMMLIIYCRLFNNQRIIILSIQAIIPVTASWWSIMCFYNLVEEEGREVFFSYPLNRWWIGVGRCMMFYLIYMSISVVVIMLCGINTLYIKDTFILLLIQSFFYLSLGFMIVIITKNTGVSIGCVMGYCSFQLITLGKLWPNIYIFDLIPKPINIPGHMSIQIVAISIAFIAVGQFSIIKTLNFK